MRIDYRNYPEIVRPIWDLTQAAQSQTLEPSLLELVKVRASQVNGCAHCLEMHTKDVRALGESDDRLHLVAAWREAPCFSNRERAALRGCEELTLISEREVPDELYEEIGEQFSEDELCPLTFAIVVINRWNRLAIAFRAQVGGHIQKIASHSI